MVRKISIINVSSSIIKVSINEQLCFSNFQIQEREIRISNKNTAYHGKTIPPNQCNIFVLELRQPELESSNP